MDIEKLEKIRNETLTEDFKMEIIADIIESGNAAVNVVEIHNMSGTLSDSDFEKIKKDNTIIVASTQYFYKQYSASTVIRYGAVPRLGVDKVIFDYINIDKGTKGYELKNETFPAEQ